MYTYFVSYVVCDENGRLCFGDVQAVIPIKISKSNSAETLQIIKNGIEKKIELKNVSILNFILLEEE